MDIGQPFFEDLSSRFGSIAVVWWDAQSGPRVRQIFLCGKKPAAKVIPADYPGARPGTCPEIDRLCGRIGAFLEGQVVDFDLGMTALEVCGDFQRRVLMAEYRIPRGRVSTYGRIAKHIGVGGGGRAAGRALAENPFPIVIPCHRAVRADGRLGGYQGGGAMKRALLEMEGVEFAAAGRVRMDRVFY